MVWSLSRLVPSSRVALGAHHSYRSLLAQIPPFIAGDVVKRNRSFLFHNIPSWIKCFHQLLGLGFRLDVVVRALSPRCIPHPHVRPLGASFLRLGLNRGALQAPHARAASLKRDLLESKAASPLDVLTVIPPYAFSIRQSLVVLLHAPPIQKSRRIYALTCPIGRTLIRSSRLWMMSTRG